MSCHGIEYSAFSQRKQAENKPACRRQHDIRVQGAKKDRRDAKRCDPPLPSAKIELR
jgi:hypothetical protein